MPSVISQSDVDLYLFYGKTCPHCKAEIQFLDSIRDKYPGLVINEYEVTGNKEDAVLFARMCEAYNTKPMGVPMTFVGEDHWTGFGAQLIVEIENKIVNCIETKCISPGEKVGIKKAENAVETKEQAIEISKKNKLVQELLNENQNITPSVKIEDEFIITWAAKKKSARIYINRTTGEITQVLQQGFTTKHIKLNQSNPGSEINKTNTVHVPIVGKIDVSNIGMPFFTFAIAIVDGFNPCTMWVLSFLMALLIHVHNRRKIIIVGSIFLVVVYLIYFLFMAAWLNLFLYLGYIDLIRIIIAIIAILAGLINMKDFLWFKKGISLSIPDRFKPKLFGKMREVVKQESIIPTIIGTIVLASFASLIELPCTSGFPAIYTKILTLQGFKGIGFYLYIMVYCIFYITLAVQTHLVFLYISCKNLFSLLLILA